MHQQGPSEIERLLQRQKELLGQLDTLLQSMPTLDVLQKLRLSSKKLNDRLSRESFHVVIVGEFSTGKSTLINALLEEPDLLPSDDLPCTSQAIEIEFGSSLRLCSQATGEEFFDVRAALERFVTLSPDHKAAAHRWNLSVPSDILRMGLTFIDTPGLSEDQIRKELAYRAAESADALVLVSSAEKLGSHEEQALVEHMASMGKPCILAINKIDLVQSPPERFRNRAADIFAPHLTIEHIICISGGLAHQALLDGQPNESAQALQELRDLIASVLQKNSARVRLLEYQSELEHIEQVLHNVLEERVSKLNQDSILVEELVRKIENTIQNGKGPLREALKNAFYTAWPGILDSLDSQKKHWKSDYSPVWSPKKYANAIAEQAKAHIQNRVLQWANSQGKEATSNTVQRHLLGLEDDIKLLAIKLGWGIQTPQYLQKELIANAMQTAFNTSVDSAADDAAWATVVAAIVSAVVGYIIADVILFYVMAAIAGFLNPVLLVAAALVGGVAFFMGASWIEDYVKSKIVSKIQEELVKPDAKKKINQGFQEAAQEVFGKLGTAFAQEARKLQKASKKSAEQALEESIQVQETLTELRTMFSSLVTG